MEQNIYASNPYSLDKLKKFKHANFILLVYDNFFRILSKIGYKVKKRMVRYVTCSKLRVLIGSV